MPLTSSVTYADGHVVVTPAMPEARPPGMGAALHLDPARTALVIVDVQTFFLETPPFHAMREIVAPLAELLPVARQAGLTVVHLRTEFDAGLHDLGREGSRTRQMIGSVAPALLAGSRTAAAPPELREAPGDAVVIKTRFSGFWGSDLDNVLRARGIETLVFAGGTTTVCVESTLRDSVPRVQRPAAHRLRPRHDARIARLGTGTDRHVLRLGLRLARTHGGAASAFTSAGRRGYVASPLRRAGPGRLAGYGAGSGLSVLPGGCQVSRHH